MKYSFSIFLILLTGMICHADQILVRDGNANAVIVVGKKPTQSAQLGAEELRYHISRITGADLPIVESPADGKVSIVISSDLNKNRERSAVRFSGNKIYLEGNDSACFDKVEYKNEKTFPDYQYRFHGTLWAVYDFLERYCGVRFFGVGDAQTLFQPRKTLSVKEENYEHSSPMDMFRDIYLHVENMSQAQSGTKLTKRDEALLRFRWRLTTFTPPANHNMYSMYFRFHGRAKSKYLAPLFIEKHPEYFARGFSYTGAGDPRILNNYPGDKTLPPQLCYTNPGVSDWYAKEVLTYAAGKNLRGGFGNKDGTILDENITRLPRIPDRMFFYPIEGGDNDQFCQCAGCKPFLRAPQNCSDLKFHLMSEIARKVAKTDPQAGVSTLAYINSMYYPDHVKLADNLSVQVCLTVYCWWHPVAWKLQHGEYKKWMQHEAKKRPMTLWTYLFSSAWDAQIHFGNYHPFPTFYPWKTAEIFKEFAQDGIRGWFCEIQLEKNMLEGYVASRICYDPSADTEKLIDEYFTMSYGAAGNAMKEFYRETEKAFWNPENCPKEWLKDPNTFVGPYGKKHPFWGTALISPELSWKKMGTPERMAKLKALVAEASAQTLTPEQKARLDHFRKTVWEDALRGAAEFAKGHQSAAAISASAIRRIPSANGKAENVAWEKLVPMQMTSPDGSVKADDRFFLAADETYLYFRYEAKKDFSNRAYVQFCFAKPDGKNECIVRAAQSMAPAPEGNFLPPAEYKSKESAGSWVCEGAVLKKDLPFQNDALKANVIRRAETGPEKPEDIAVWQPTWYSGEYTSPQYFSSLCIMPKIVGADQFTCEGKAVRMEDAAAWNGKTARMDASEGWTVKYFVPQELCGKHKITVSLRTDAAKSDAAFNIGVFDKFNRTGIMAKEVNASKYAGTKYQTVDLGDVNLIPGCYLYFSTLRPKPQSGTYHYYIDKIVFE